LRTLTLFLVLFTLSTVTHLLGGHWWRESSVLDVTGEDGKVASSLAESGRFADPYVVLPTGPTAVIAPGYPYLLSGVIRVFGLGPAAWWAIHLLTIAAYSLQWALMPWFARVWGLPSRIGFTAAVVGALMPIPGTCFKWEALFVGLILAFLAGLTGLLVQKADHNGLWLVTATVWGVGLLFSPVLLLPWLGWLALLVYKLGYKVSWRKAAILFVLPLLITTPWTIRNYQTFHHFFLIRDILGQTLHDSNNDCTTGWVKADIRSGCLTSLNPYDNLELAQRVAREGEYQFNADYLRDGVQWIRQNPKRFVALTLLRIRFFWFPPIEPEERTLGKLNMVAIWVLTVLSVPGLYLIYQTHRWAGRLLLSGMLLYPAIYSIAQIDLRYRYPILWMTVFAAAALLCRAGAEVLRSKHGSTADGLFAGQDEDLAAGRKAT
jgi:hypothetical protein